MPKQDECLSEQVTIIGTGANCAKFDPCAVHSVWDLRCPRKDGDKKMGDDGQVNAKAGVLEYPERDGFPVL